MKRWVDEWQVSILKVIWTFFTIKEEKHKLPDNDSSSTKTNQVSAAFLWMI